MGMGHSFVNWDPSHYLSSDAILTAFPLGPDSVPLGTTERTIPLSGFFQSGSAVKITSTRIEHQPIRISILDSQSQQTDVIWDAKPPAPLSNDYSINHFSPFAYPGFSYRHFATIGNARATEVLAIDPTGRKPHPLPQVLGKAINALLCLFSSTEHVSGTDVERVLDVKLSKVCQQSQNNPELLRCKMQVEQPFAGAIKEIAFDANQSSSVVIESVTLSLEASACVKQSDMVDAVGDNALTLPVLAPPIFDSFGLGKPMTAKQYRRLVKAMAQPRSYFFQIKHVLGQDRRATVEEAHGCAAAIEFRTIHEFGQCPNPAYAIYTAEGVGR
jgi:hypothetical protein